MNTTSLFALILAALTLSCASAAGVGKAWEVSQVQKADNHGSPSPWPRMDSSPFEVRSISGVGRLAPVETRREASAEWSEARANRDGSKEASESSKDHPEKGESSGTEAVSQLRESRELEDLENGNTFIPEDVFREPAVEEFLRRSKEVEEVEALPSVWEKFRARGRTGRHFGGCSEVEEVNSDSELLEDKPRVRREVEAEMEKIAASKNVREARLSSPESWSKQPLSVEFRHRTELEKVADEEEKLSRPSGRGFEAPRADFVTANRRSFTEGREAREMPLVSARSYDEMPATYRNTPRDRDYDLPYSRSLFYPERYRTERDYFVRGLNEPAYPQDRYRDVEFDLYGRSRPPMPKPKRIIYYATLPEIVRKPVDVRNYPRAYDVGMTRSSSKVLSQDDYYRRPLEPLDSSRYRYYSYPYSSNYDSYDAYSKMPTWNDRMYMPHTQRIEDVRRREQDVDHASMRDATRTEEPRVDQERKAELAKSRDQEKMSWPVKMGTEVSVKENDRISSRKIYGQHEDYNRFRNNARMDRDREGTGSAESRD